MASSSPGDWRSSFGQGVAPEGDTRMVAVRAGQQSAHSVSGAGGGTMNAFTLPTVSLRHASESQMTIWELTLKNLCALHNLGELVREGKPPERSAVIRTWPELSGEAITEKYNECLRDYQRENTVLFYYVISSLDLKGQYMDHDMQKIIREFIHGDLRDGNGLLQWFRSFHNLTAPDKQKALRARLAKFKILLDTTHPQLLKLLLDYLATWENLIGNDRNNPVILNDYYVRILDIWPTMPYENPIVRVRAFASHMHQMGDKMLDDAAVAINAWVKCAIAYGVPAGKPPSNTVLAVEGRLTAADNDCQYCDVFNCKAGNSIKECVVYNEKVKTGDNTPFFKAMQINFIKSARAHLKQNPELKTMKGVKFLIDKSSSGGKGKGGGGRGGGGRGGGSAGRSAAPVVMSSVAQAELFGDVGENPEDFEAWVLNQQDGDAGDEVGQFRSVRCARLRQLFRWR